MTIINFDATNPSMGTERIDQPVDELDMQVGEFVLERPQLHSIALEGILKEIADAACANTEAVPITVAVHTLALFSAMLGRTAYIQIGDQCRHLRMNSLIVGPTSKGRKGTSTDNPNQLFSIVHRSPELPIFMSAEPLKKLGGLATGEGLISLVRDDYVDRTGEVHEGVKDKRLFVDVSEFAAVLAQSRKENSSISMVIRDAFDGCVLVNPTKTSYTQSTGSHIVIVGSIPETELVKLLSNTDITNGLANRFPMFYAVREKLVANPSRTDPALMECLAARLVKALSNAVTLGEVPMTPAAQAKWADIYIELNQRTYPPAVASLMARVEVYARIFSTLLALINCESVVDCKHLDAALAWINYWEQSVMFVFSNSQQSEQAELHKVIDAKVLQGLRELGGKNVTHTDLTKRLTHNGKSKTINGKLIQVAIERLQRASPSPVTVTRLDTTGRPANIYSLTNRE